ncbi:MAG: hypothetical protein RQ736_08940 [Thiogranum sp.]|nr:hypothetical protein [Thiogranum sp.]
MSNHNMNAILERIKDLQGQLEDELSARQEQLSYELQDRKVRFTRAIRELHREYKVGLIEFFGTASIRHILVAPIIYTLIVPLALLDLSVSVYQQLCFRAFRIPRVRRSDYVIIDRHQLSYLNIIEKINCVYCGYGNGVLAFAGEIAARTEQYWCPIKHARRVLSAHSRVASFVSFADYGDAAAFRRLQPDLRKDLGNE